MDDLMTKIQEAGEARQERDKAIDEAEELQGQIERLTKERDEAIAKAEDLQEIVDTDAREFEGECWGGLSQLLDECGYQWTPGDSVTVTNAVDHIRETLQDKDRWAEKAEKERDQLAQALTEANRAVEKIAQERDEARARASLDCDATTDGAHEPVSQGKYQFCRQCGETINAPTMTERARKAEARAEKAEKERDEARASAAGVLLDQWLFGAFEDTADAAADDAITQQWAHVDRTYPDAAPIIEAWLRALIDKPDAANG